MYKTILLGPGAFIAIRTLGTTKLLGIRNNSSGMTTEELATISRLDIGDKQPVDMVFSESVNMQQPSLIVVNDQGDVYKCTPEGEKYA
ncbi:hypothetical protein PHLCEN_2v5909 [Hermanssonia centrifuga]|uniref:Uncharacterized protein n=1 Tax=Hermanssonia centrifuga TaxID=98765 RepID=A0A2R6P183_9APHY|nr:hypothetical protein PHLCEN_2v5909 [Hermanssonia centrifuga]